MTYVLNNDLIHKLFLLKIHIDYYALYASNFYEDKL